MKRTGAGSIHPETTERFAFGANWHQFLSVMTNDRIAKAEASLVEMLGVPTLRGKRMLDIGCGSGLFSLAAKQLGAEVYSFDYDALSVACAQEMKRAHFPGDDTWQIARGSVLDDSYMKSIGTFDIVYSWGVLHHTGDMWTALDRTSHAVAPQGRLFVALYNDQGWKSIWWTKVKRTYNLLPSPLRPFYMLAFGAALESGALALSLLRRKPRQFVERWTRYDNVRGMSRWHDVVDWVGGYPFEVATPNAVTEFCAVRGFKLLRSKTCGKKLGCNEFVFERSE